MENIKTIIADKTDHQTKLQFMAAFLQINADLNILYERRKKLIDGLVTLGIGKVLIAENPDKTWTRVTVMDNAERINDGYYEYLKVERFSVKIENLKNMPKELKEV